MAEATALSKLSWRRAAGVLSAMLVLVLALVLAAAATLWWWSGQEGSLRTALQWATRHTAVGLQAQDVRGSLRHGGLMARLTWQNESGLHLQIDQLSLRWNLVELLPSALSTRPAIHLLELQADRLQLTPGPSAGPQPPPDSLALPVDLRVDTLRVRELHWAGTPTLELQEVAASYRYSADQHAIEVQQLRHAQGLYQGRAQLQATGQLALDAQLTGRLIGTLPSGQGPLTLALQASAHGPLQALQVQARLQPTPGQGRAAASRAQVEALLTPWRSPAVTHVQAQAEQLDLALLWPRAPRTRLSGRAGLEPQGSGWRFDTELLNRAPGPWDRGQWPVDSLRLRGQWESGLLMIEALQARLGSGQLQGSGQWMPASAPSGQPGWQLQARFEGLQPDQIDSRWPAQRLQGQARAVQAPGQQALQFEMQLQAQAAPEAARRGLLQAWQLRQAQARGQWLAGTLQIDHLELRSHDAQLTGAGRFKPTSLSGQGQLALKAPGLELSLQSAWPLPQGAGQLDLRVPDVQQALSWLGSLPALPQSLAGRLHTLRAQGRLELRLDWERELSDAQIRAMVDLPVLQDSASALPPLAQLRASAQGRLSQLQWQGSAQTRQGARALSAQLAGQASLDKEVLQQSLSSGLQALQGQLRLDRLTLDMDDPAAGRWRLINPQPLQLAAGSARVEVEPGQMQLQPLQAQGQSARLQWHSLRWLAGQLQTSGQLQGLPLAWAELLAGPVLARAGMVGDMVFDGRWDLELGPQLRLQAELQRRSGDLSLHAETSAGLGMRVAAGVRQARLALSARNEDLTLDWRWDSERAGQSQGQLRTRLQRQPEGWRWPDDAALSGQLQAQLPRLGVWSALAPPGWRLRGSLLAELAVAGTRKQPELGGQLQADDLALRSVVEGIELGGGRLRARLEGQRLLLQELSLQGQGAQGGLLQATGQARWTPRGPELDLQARLSRLRASVRSDRQLTVSGELQGRLRGLPGQVPVDITGSLRLDQARLSLPDEDRPQLGSDVRIKPVAARTTAAPAERLPVSAPVRLAVQVELGEDVQVQGKGLNARLRGALTVTSQDLAQPPRLTGSVTTASGEYRAYGQRLNIERGVLRFTGPADNPALDILALRPNLSQPIGVQVSGTALLPRVRLYAEPELPEAEKLAWLVLGRSGASGGAEAAVLQQAALALLGSRSAIQPGGLAASLGLDELSLRGASSLPDGTATGGALTVGKRLSSQFYAIYESSLSGALGTLYLFYDLSQRVTVRAQTGAQTAVDLIYTLPYD